jgi:hypothetical protein
MEYVALALAVLGPLEGGSGDPMLARDDGDVLNAACEECWCLRQMFTRRAPKCPAHNGELALPDRVEVGAAGTTAKRRAARRKTMAKKAAAVRSP